MTIINHREPVSFQQQVDKPSIPGRLNPPVSLYRHAVRQRKLNVNTNMHRMKRTERMAHALQVSPPAHWRLLRLQAGPYQRAPTHAIASHGRQERRCWSDSQKLVTAHVRELRLSSSAALGASSQHEQVITDERLRLAPLHKPNKCPRQWGDGRRNSIDSKCQSVLSMRGERLFRSLPSDHRSFILPDRRMSGAFISMKA